MLRILFSFFKLGVWLLLLLLLLVVVVGGLEMEQEKKLHLVVRFFLRLEKGKGLNCLHDGQKRSEESKLAEGDCEIIYGWIGKHQFLKLKYYSTIL